MKKALRIVIVLIGFSSLSQTGYSQPHHLKFDPVGIGLLHITLRDQHIPMYDSDKSVLPFDTIKIEQLKDGIGKGTFRFITSTTKGVLDPYNLYPGRIPTPFDSRKDLMYKPIDLTFRAIQKTGSNYNIVVNEKTKQTAVIKRSGTGDTTICTYEDWETYFKSCDNIEVYDNDHKIPIFKHRNGKVIDSISDAKFKVNEIRGYWLAFTYLNDNSPNTIYWLKWRDDDKILLQWILNFKNYSTFISNGRVD